MGGDESAGPSPRRQPETFLPPTRGLGQFLGFGSENPRVARASPERSRPTSIEVLARGGDDTARVDPRSGGFTDEVTTIDGGPGADTLVGHIGIHTLIGGSATTPCSAVTGDDRALLGTGNDTYTWNPGDDNDTIEGEAGIDVLDFNGSNIAETLDVSANGPRVRVLRDIASIAMDLGGVETVHLATRGGTDTIVAGNTAGTELETVDVGLSADAQADSVIVGGTTEADSVQVGSDGGAQLVSSLAAELRVTDGEAHDEITLASNVSELIGLVLDLGADD